MPKGGSRIAAGRKVLPINEKVAKGTFRPERQKKIPKPDERLPIPPSWLNKRAKQIFRLEVKRISGITVASIDHTRAISMLAIRAEQVERLTKFLDINGSTYEKDVWVGGKGGCIVKELHVRPEVKERHEAMKHLHSLLLEFGLTASSLGRVAAKPKKDKEENEFEGF